MPGVKNASAVEDRKLRVFFVSSRTHEISPEPPRRAANGLLSERSQTSFDAHRPMRQNEPANVHGQPDRRKEQDPARNGQNGPHQLPKLAALPGSTAVVQHRRRPATIKAGRCFGTRMGREKASGPDAGSHPPRLATSWRRLARGLADVEIRVLGSPVDHIWRG